MRAAVAKLPDAQRLALTLHYFEDQRYEDIAEVMGVPLNTVKSHIRRGKERLAVLLRPALEGRAVPGGLLMDDRQLWEPNDQPAWERDLDALVRPSLVMDPPADVQQAILAAVLQAAAPAPCRCADAAGAGADPEAADARPIPLAAYLLLAAVLVAYVATLSWLQGLFGGTAWLPR